MIWSLDFGLWAVRFHGDGPPSIHQSPKPKDQIILQPFSFPPNASARWYAAQTAFESTVRRLPFSIW